MKIKLENILKKRGYNTIDYIYFGIGIIFITILVFELFRYIAGYYSLKNATIIFLIATLCYSIYRQENIKQHARILQEKNNIDIEKIFLIYGGVFFYTFFFDGGRIFQYASIILMLSYIVLRFFGEKAPSCIPQKYEKQTVFYQVLFLSLSLYLICISWLLQSFNIVEGKNSFLFFTTFLYAGFFTFVFSNTFQNLFGYLQSRKFRKWMIDHTYIILTLCVLSLGTLALAYKSGLIGDTIRNYQLKKASIIVDTDLVFSVNSFKESQAEEQEIVPQTQKIGELFTLVPGLSLGSSGNDVAKLQESLSLLGYYKGETSSAFDTVTQKALIQALQKECNWPESTLGIFGPQAKLCIDNLEVVTP